MDKDKRAKIKNLIDINRRAIKSALAKEALRKDPSLLIREKELHDYQVNGLLNSLQDHFESLSPFVSELKKNVKDITEETHFNAVYLLMCSAFESWKAFFVLSKKGHHVAAMILIRNIKETLSIAELFSIESFEGRQENLQKWFSGELIMNGVCRTEIDKFHQKYWGIESREISGDLYWAESQAPHSSYESILECVSPFTEDFDFDGHVMSRRTLSAVRYSKGSLETTNITLKFIACFLLRDEKLLKQMNDVLVKFNPLI